MVLLQTSTKYIAILDNGQRLEWGLTPPPGMTDQEFQQQLIDEALLIETPPPAPKVKVVAIK